MTVGGRKEDHHSGGDDEERVAEGERGCTMTVGERKKIIRVMVVTRKGSREAIKALYNDGGGKGRSPE